MAICLLGASAQTSKPLHDSSPIVRAMMNKFHCEPPKTEDILAHRVIVNMVASLDPSRLYFTKLDIDTINGQADLLKAELKGRDTKFLSRFMQMYKSRLQAADSAVSRLMRRPLDYTKKEYTYIRDSIPEATSAELSKKWEQALKYETLRQLANILLADSNATPASVMKQEASARDKVCRSTLRKVRRPQTYPAGFEAYVTEELCNSICKAYDPHSDYFTRAAKENFEGQVSGESYMFGFDIDENENEEVTISHVLPGSPAWRSGELNKGDVIISLRWAGQEAMDLQGADAAEISKLLDDQNHKDVQLGIRKPDGTQKQVWLEKQKLELEENFVRSYVLDAGDTKVGYIVLPGFYEESESKNGKNCAADVAREVVKLKKENIQSLILDMRNNGGGSMNEAMQLAGIFIDEGVLALAKYNTDKPSSIKDPNRGAIYDGPLVVMVNKASASASEMVASALQDYNRALIVGSPTYGKATMQVVFPLDSDIDLERYSEGSFNLGTEFVKITLGRFYRVTGSTHQLKGVQPDIYLPDLTEAAGFGESYQRYALKPDSVKRATYFKPLPALPVADLSAKSSARVKSSASFTMIGKYADFVRKATRMSKEAIPLQYEEYLAFAKKYRKEAMSLEKEYETIHRPGSYKTHNPAADEDRIKMEHQMADEIKKTIENIDKDLYIQECFSIITDYLKTAKK